MARKANSKKVEIQKGVPLRMALECVKNVLGYSELRIERELRLYRRMLSKVKKGIELPDAHYKYMNALLGLMKRRMESPGIKPEVVDAIAKAMREILLTEYRV